MVISTHTKRLNLIASPFGGIGGAPEWRKRTALAAHYLKRIADHGVDIGGRTVFLITGKPI
jgi:phosphate transport system protein